MKNCPAKCEAQTTRRTIRIYARHGSNLKAAELFNSQPRMRERATLADESPNRGLVFPQ